MKFQLLILVLLIGVCSCYVITNTLIAGTYNDIVVITKTQSVVRSFDNATYFYMRLEAPEPFNATFYIGDTMVDTNIVDSCNITYVCYFEYSEMYLPIKGNVAIYGNIETKLNYEYQLEQNYNKNWWNFYLPILGIMYLLGLIALIIICIILFGKESDKSKTNGKTNTRTNTNVDARTSFRKRW